MKKLKWFLLFLILSLAFLLGARMILAGDFFYLYDQARDYLLVKDVVVNHTLMLIGSRSGLGGFFHGPLWIYAIAPIYILTHGSPFGLAYFYVGLQLFTVFVGFLVGSKLYGEKSGLLVALLIALSPTTWAPVINTVSADAEPLVYLALFYFLVRFLRGDTKSFIFAIFFTGLAFQFETASSIVLFPTVIVMFFFGKEAFRNLKVIFLSLISFAVSVTSFILFDLRHKFLMTHAILGAFSGGTKGKGYMDLNVRIISHFSGLLRAYLDPLFNQNILLTLLFVAIIIFALALVLKSKKDKYKKEFLLLLVFPAIFFGFFIFYAYPVWPEYVFGLLVPVALMFYLAMFTVWKNAFGKALVVLFFIVTFFSVSGYLSNQYLTRYRDNGTSGSYKSQKAVVEWIYADAQSVRNSVGEKFGYFVYTPEIFTHGMDYLFYWYGKNNQKILFENKKDSISYLILYPHLANDNGAYDFWKKNILKTQGKVVLEKMFSSGITAQKLLIDKTEPPVDPNYYQGLIFR